MAAICAVAEVMTSRIFTAPDESKPTVMPRRRRQQRTAEKRYAAWEQGCRSKWRALLLCIKAKLESVEAGIETFEDAFLAHIQLPDGQTVGEHAKPMIARAYETGTMQPLLPGPKSS